MKFRLESSRSSSIDSAKSSPIEFGEGGPEGIRHEGIDVTKGYGALRQEVPFAGEYMNKQDFRPEDDATNSQNDDTAKQIEYLKNNLHLIFERKPAPTSAPAPEYGQVAPRTPPVGGESTAHYDDDKVEVNQMPQPEKTEAEKQQIKSELKKQLDEIAKILERRDQQPSEPQLLSSEKQKETQEENNRIKEIEEIQSGFNTDMLKIVKSMEYRRQHVRDFDHEKAKKDPNYRRLWEEEREMIKNDPGFRIVDIDGVYNLGGDYYAGIVTGDGAVTNQKITAEEYSLLKKQFPDEHTPDVSSYLDQKQELDEKGSDESIQEKTEEAIDIVNNPDAPTSAVEEQVSQFNEFENPEAPAPVMEERTSRADEVGGLETSPSTIEGQVSQPEEDDPKIKEEVVKQILSKIIDAGDFHNSGIDIAKKMHDIDYAKYQLMKKPLNILQKILSTYR